KHIDQKTVSQTIDVMVKADPSLAWLREAENRATSTGAKSGKYMTASSTAIRGWESERNWPLPSS
ncbi:hypothetical protein, partial [Acinetobacter baumannii]|uniref:hypothetical protein n=1 Tax=Acinetobacter baumannii TaxID=470 RepID=UPI0025B1C192